MRIERIIRSIKQLEENEKINIKFKHVSAKPSKILKTHEVSLLHSHLNFPGSIQQLIDIDQTLGVLWQYGEYKLGNLLNGEFMLKKPSLFLLENELPQTYQELKDTGVDLRFVRLFDCYAYNGGPVYALLPAKDNTIEDRILIFDERKVYETDLTIDIYLDMMPLTYGLFYWQYLFCIGRQIDEYEISHLQRGLAFIEQEFKTDCHPLRNRLRQHEKSAR